MRDILIHFDSGVNFGMLVLNVTRYKLRAARYTNSMKAIILAAGEGKRMRPLTLAAPKPMIEVLGKPILQHLIESLPEEVTELIMVIGYKGEQIEKYFGKKFNGRSIIYVWQKEQLGTGHALTLCKDLFQPGEKFMFMAGDDLHSPQALKNLITHEHAALASTHTNPRRFGVFEVDTNGKIISFEETPEEPKSNIVSLAVFVLSADIFKYPSTLSAKGEYWATDQIRQMMADKSFFVEKADFWHPIGYPEDIEKAEAALADKYRIGTQQKRDTPVIILAGGKGTRMPENEKDKPKCLVDVAGKPMLEWQLEDLRKQGFANITLSLGYKAEMVIDWLKNTGNADIEYVIETEPLGTGGGIRLALGDTREPFIGINCDDFADINLTSLMRHSSNNTYNVISAMETPEASTFGLIECDEFQKVCTFKEKDPNSTQGLVSIGHYYLQPDVFDGMPNKFSIEIDLFPKLAVAGKLVLHRHTGNYWVTANNAEQLRFVRDHFEKIK
jgi:NDP-sugar pyrophosphorylase family protein